MDSGGMSCCCTSLVEGISDSGVRSHCAGLLKAGKQACLSGDLPSRGAAGMGKDKHTGAAALLDVPPLRGAAEELQVERSMHHFWGARHASRLAVGMRNTGIKVLHFD